jgi:chemotaxis protein MotB
MTSQRWQIKLRRSDHTDDWLMTYADMITLLLCFFAIFLSVAIARKDLPAKAETPPPVQQLQTPPDILEGNLPFHGLEQVPQPDVLEGNLPFHDPMTEQETDDNASASSTGSMQQTAVNVPDILKEVKDQEQKGGDRITIIDMNSAAFFGSGSAILSLAGKAILRDLAEKLKTDKYKEYQITVEGHTDDSPINTVQFPSNWELSTGRAAAVVHYFLSEGVPPRKLRAAGYADTFPKVPNRDANGNALPQNQAQNRRVVIKLEKIDKE